MEELAVRYRQFAANCLRTAQLITDLKMSASLLDMAQAWLALADQAERSARTARNASEIAFNARAKAQGTGQEPSESAH